MSALTFAEPLPGLAPHTPLRARRRQRRRRAVQHAPLDDLDLRLFLLDAAVCAPGYTPELAAAGLGLGSPADARVLVVAPRARPAPR